VLLVQSVDCLSVYGKEVGSSVLAYMLMTFVVTKSTQALPPCHSAFQHVKVPQCLHVSFVSVVLLGHIEWPIAVDDPGCQSVSLMWLHCANTAERIEVQLGLETLGDQGTLC